MDTAYFTGNLTQARVFLEESLSLSQEIGNSWASGRRLVRLGLIVHAQGNLAQGVALIKEGLVICRQAGDKSGIACALAGLGSVARVDGELVRAIRVMGSLAAFCEATGATLWLTHRQEHERNVALAREQMDAVMFDATWAEGLALTLEQAIAYAMEAPAASKQAVEPPTSNQAAKRTFDGLTAREREVAAHIARGESNRDIAQALVISERTVETHVTNILNKLGFARRSQIRKWAIEKALPE
jgi:non-specific serine/threonine protein kinase